MDDGRLQTNLETIHIGCLVSYDGTDYKGFQYQVEVPTIQGELESALQKITRVSYRITASGRTDTGVHARGQVISTRLPWKHDLVSLQRAWNVNLPRDIAVRQLTEVPDDFHPRFSAKRRTYHYTVFWDLSTSTDVNPKNSPLTDRYALYETSGLDIESMNLAAAFLVGNQDFATFGRSPQEMSSVRTVFEAEWRLVQSDLPIFRDSGRLLVFTITANGFLRHMVRNLVGSLLEVGRGRWSPSDFFAALKAQERSRSAPLVPPNGLVLETVDYPKHLDLFR